MVTSALTAALLGAHLLASAWRAQRGAMTRCHPAGWLLLPFLAYAAANVLWITPVRWLGWLDWLGWAQMIAVFWVVLNGVRSRRGRATLAAVVAALGFLAVVLAAYQRFVKPDWLMLGRTQAEQFIGRASGPFGIPNSLAALLLLLLPPALAFTVRRGAPAVQRVLGGYLVAVFAFGLGLTVSRGAWLALVLVAAAAPLFARRGSPRRRVVVAFATAGAAMMVLAVLYAAVPVVRARLSALKRDRGEVTRPIMWRGAWEIFREHPAWGGGAGSYEVLLEAHRPENFQDEPRWAHNDYLNTLSDHGAVGAGLFFGAVGAIAWRCSRRSSGKSAGRASQPARGDLGGRRIADGANWIDEAGFNAAMAVGLAAFGLQLFVDFHFKIPALAMAFATVAGLVVQRRWNDTRETRTPRSAGRFAAGVAVGGPIALALVVIAGEMVWVQPFYRGEALRRAARQAIDGLARKDFERERWRKVLGESRAALIRAVALAPANGAAWADLAYATVLTGHVEPEQTPQLAREAERAADAALACSRAVAVFWVRRGVALDLQGRSEEAGRAFDEAVRLGPQRASIWFNYAFHLSLDRTAPERAEAAVTTCLRLDPGNREAQALRRRLADRSRAP